MYNRKFYINRLFKWRDQPVIKIITGIRRSGKSTLIKLFIDHLLKSGVDKNRIVYINKESLQFEDIQTYSDLYNTIRQHSQRVQKKLYVFVDEVQQIEQWEKAAISLFSEDIADLYFAGSNARLLSAELATLLGGRYIEISVFPLTYSEFLLFRGKQKSSDTDFRDYLEVGGMPGIHHLHWERPIIFEYLNAVFDTIVLKDIVRRNNIRNVAFLEKIIRFIFDNTAQIFSGKRVVDFLKKEQRRTNIETVYNYIQYLVDAFIVRRVPRYDIKGKRLLEVREKYFLTDTGLRHAVLGYKEQDINQLLENIVYIELKKRNYKVYVGQFANSEIDFIVEKDDQRAYIQVTYLLASEKAMEREFGTLARIRNNYPKYVMSLDKYFTKDWEGIKHINIIDFLLSEDMIF